jgi:pilus assembly protein CpaB
MTSTENKNWLILLSALVVGGLAAISTKSYIAQKIESLEASDKNKTLVKVVVAKDHLEKGSVLSSENMATRDIPKQWAHSDAITPDQFNRATGARLAFPANAGEPVLWAQVEGEKAGNFSTRLDIGRRALTVPVDEVSSISGMLAPDDLIDIIVSVQKESRSYTFTLLQSMRVLATGTKVAQSNADENGKLTTYTTVTLDTSPEDAKKLIAAREVGRITALLRAPTDHASVSLSRAEANELLGLGNGDANGLSSVPVIYGGGPIKTGLNLNPTNTQEALEAMNQNLPQQPSNTTP